MTSRSFLTLLFLLIAAGLLKFSVQNDNDVHDMALNLGAEIIGIIVTITLLDAMQDRRQREAESRKVAWEVLHELDHAMWVWQGGEREFDIDELKFLCDAVDDGDPLPDFTETLLLRIGSRSENTLRTKPDLLKVNEPLNRALFSLQFLARIRDRVPREPNHVWAGHIKHAVTMLARGLRAPELGIPPVLRPGSHDPSVARQRWRHFGAPLQAGENPAALRPNTRGPARRSSHRRPPVRGRS